MNKDSFDKILLAIDSTAPSWAAVGAIAQLAATTGAEVLVLHVWNLGVRVNAGTWNVETLTEARELVDEVVADLVAAGVKASGELVNAAESKVGSAIEDAAESYGADLVAVGSRGLSDLAAIFEGSVSHRLIADLDCPVLVAGAGSYRSRPLQRILLAVSNQAEAAALADLAIAVAKPTGASILVLHVLIHPMVANEYAFYLEPEEEAQAVVDRTIERIRTAGLEAAGKVKGGILPVVDEIVETAQGWDADLLITGSRRHRDLAALLVGATEHELIRQARRPVLIAARETR